MQLLPGPVPRLRDGTGRYRIKGKFKGTIDGLG